MTPEQKAAFIVSQAARLNAEVAMFQAENQERMNRGEALANGPSQFAELIAGYDAVLGHNAVIIFFDT